MGARLALYWHNGNGLGHAAQSTSIGRALSRVIPGLSIIGITGASGGYEFVPQNIDVVKLPSYLSYDNKDGFHREPISSLTEAELFHMREELITTFMKNFRPHALLIDLLPQGVEGELVPAIISSSNTKKILGVRGVIFDPQETNKIYFNSRMSSFIDEHFCSILVYCDPQVFRWEDHYDVPSFLKAKLRYTGYLAERIELTKTEARIMLGLDPNTRLIVVGFGGGQGTYPMWHQVLKSLKYLQGQFDLAHLALGSYLESEAYDQLLIEAALQPNLRVSRFLDRLPLWMKASDLFLGAGGFSMLGEVVSTNANALIVPRQYEETEQEIHSARLAELGVIRVAKLAQVLNGELPELLQQCLTNPLQHHLSFEVDGAQKAALIIKDILKLI